MSTAVLIGAGVGAAVLYLVLRQRGRLSASSSAPSSPSSPAGLPSAPGDLPRSVVRLGLPLASSAPFSITPNGYYGAPRWVVGGESMGTPPHPGARPDHYHEGVDLAARAGAEVLAIGDGAIVPAQSGYGKAILKLALDAPGTWEMGARPLGALVSHVVYADLGDRLVVPGARVRAGQPIARVASRGFVHFAIKRLQAGREEFFDPALAGFPYRQRLIA